MFIYIRFLKGRITIFKKFINKKQKYIKKNVLLHSWKIHRTLLQTKIKKESDSTIIYQSRNLTNTFISINLLDLEEDIYVINIIDVINNRREQYLLTIE